MRDSSHGGGSFGQSVTFTATVTGAFGDPTGTVDFTSDGTTIDGCESAALSTYNGATTATCTTSALSVATHTLEAIYSGNSTYAAGSPGQESFEVDQDATNVATTLTTTTITAVVSGQVPGAGQPTGSVSFELDGSTATPIGTAPVVDGVATLDYAVPSTTDESIVSDSYSGDADFAPSEGGYARFNPILRAGATSALPESSFGWYRSAVSVTFSCGGKGDNLTAPCPGKVTLRHDGAGQSVTRTIQSLDGGTATATVADINIDRTAPLVTVLGVRPGQRRVAPGTKPKCKASDPLSGIASCTVTTSKHGRKVRYRVVATDRAGNQTVRTGHYTYRRSP
jgi:hypothetical protein